jgi:hypothetical protein
MIISSTYDEFGSTNTCFYTYLFICHPSFPPPLFLRRGWYRQQLLLLLLLIPPPWSPMLSFFSPPSSLSPGPPPPPPVVPPFHHPRSNDAQGPALDSLDPPSWTRFPPLPEDEKKGTITDVHIINIWWIWINNTLVFTLNFSSVTPPCPDSPSWTRFLPVPVDE